MTRPRFSVLVPSLLGLICLAACCCFAQDEMAAIPATGMAPPGMASYDRVVRALMVKWHIPGAAVAVLRNDRLVLARGYGFADRDARETVQPDSLFRIASVSKPITATAILRLVEQGRLNLDDRAFDILKDLQPPPGATVDPRLRTITIRQLLQHAGGWDRDKSFDPMFIPERAARALGEPAPARARTVVRYMMGQPLQFDPGTQYAYSNFGYCVLGRIIEKVSGQDYQSYMRERLLRPMGITDMRIGHTRLNERAAGEVHYYDYPGAPLVRSVFSDVKEPVPTPYGGFYLEALDAHGGWIASAVDLMRFVAAEDRYPQRPDFLSAASLSLMLERPAPPLWVNTPTYYGMGWSVRPVQGGRNWWHNGSLPGTLSLMVRAYNGLCWAIVINTRPQDADACGGEMDNAMWQAAAGVTQWPDDDLFQRTGSTTSPNP